MTDSHIVILGFYFTLLLDTQMENCEVDRSILKRRLAASAVEIERQVIYYKLN